MTPRFGNRVNGKGVNLYFISESRLPSLPFEPVFRIEFTPCPGQVVLFSELCPTRFPEDLHASVVWFLYDIRLHCHLLPASRRVKLMGK